MKDDPGAYAVFTEQGSSASQMTAAKVMDVIARLPDCDGQAADAVSAYTHRKMEDAPTLQKNQSQNVQTYGYVFHHTNVEILGKHGRSRGTSRTKCAWLPLTRIFTEKSIRGSSVGTLIGKSTKLGMSFCSSKTKINFIGLRG